MKIIVGSWGYLRVGEAFRRKGYAVHETGGGGADGGVDLTISKEGKTYLVQCKQWKTRQVGVKPVRELAGLVAAHGMAGGVMVTSGDYTEEAKSFAKQARISLMAGEQLHALIKTVSGNQKPVEPSVNIPAQAESSESIHCPQCGSIMVKREAKNGPNSGKQFFGCSNYPKCRGTRAIA